MSISNFLVPNSFRPVYINEFGGNVTFDENIQVNGNINFNGSITGGTFPLPSPGPNNTVLQTNAVGVVGFEQLNFASVPHGLPGQVLVTDAITSQIEWEYLDAGSGATGATGVAGSTGATGATGISGTIGATGATGINGNTGATGVNGGEGATGATGINGTAGINGSTGATGANGIQGATGANGIQGATGVAGTNGTNGSTGATGANGIQGATGVAGTNGTNGSTGATGANGIQGATGVTGIQGATGVTGIQGATGVAGTNGTNGSTGATGANGIQGATGANGIQGATGATGVNGTNGTNGSTGATGVNGATGVQGATGAAGGIISLGLGVGLQNLGTSTNPILSLISDVPNTIVGGTGISASNTATNQWTIYNNGVNSLSAGNAFIAVGGTAQNPTISTQNIVTSITPSTGIVNSGTSTIPVLAVASTVPTSLVGNTGITVANSSANTWTISSTNPNNTLINNQVASTTSGNNIYEISDNDVSQYVLCDQSNNRVQINGGGLKITGIPNAYPVNNKNLLYYDNVTNLVSYDTNVNPAPILYQYNDTAHTGSNIVSIIGSTDETALVACSTGPSEIQLTAANVAITGTNLTLPSLPSAINTNMLLFNSSTNEVTYYPGPSTWGFAVTLSANFSPSSANIILPDAGVFVLGNYGYNNSSAINLTTGVFIAPATANYVFGACVLYSNSLDSAALTDTLTVFLWDATNSAFVAENQFVCTTATAQNYQVNGFVKLTSGNTYEFRFAYTQGTGTKTISSGNNGTRVWCQKYSLQ